MDNNNQTKIFNVIYGIMILIGSIGIAYVTIYNYTINNTDLAALIIGIICLVLGLIAAIGLIKL